MKKCAIFLGLSGFLFVSVASASAIFNVVPNMTSTTVRSDGYVTVTYTVTNETSQTLSGLTVRAAGTAQAGSLTVQNNTCNTTVASGHTCNFDLVVKAAVKNQPSNFVLSPYVCAYGGVICSQPSSANRTQVTVGPAPATYAYFSVVAVEGLTEPNASTLVPVNTSSLKVSTTPAMSLTFNNNGLSDWGQGVAVSPDGSRVYVTSGEQAVVALSAGTAPAILGSVTISDAAYLSQLVVSPDGKTIYATSASDGSIFVVNNNDGVYTQGTSIAASGQGLAISEDGSKLFATDYWSNHLYVVDPAHPADITTVSCCNLDSPYSIVISPGGNTVYVGNWGTGVSVFQYLDGTYNCAASSVVGSSINATNMAITPNGRYLYVVDIGRALYVVDTSTNTVIDADTLSISGIYGLAVTPDGTKLFISADTSGVFPTPTSPSPAYVYTINSDGSLTNPQSIDVGGNQDTQGNFAG